LILYRRSKFTDQWGVVVRPGFQGIGSFTRSRDDTIDQWEMDIGFGGEKSFVPGLIQYFGIPWFMPLRWSSPPSKAVKEANEGFREAKSPVVKLMYLVDNKCNATNLTEREIRPKDSFDCFIESFGSRDWRSVDNIRNCGYINWIHVQALTTNLIM
jgi:hypothetical protein